MNKKGQEETGSRGGLIAAIIAAFVLVLVIIGAYLFFSGKLPFFEWLPSWNQTKPRMGNVEILAYSFSDSKVKYYDGVSWTNFEGQTVEMNEKTIKYADIEKNFTENSAFFKQKTETSDYLNHLYADKNVGLKMLSPYYDIIGNSLILYNHVPSSMNKQWFDYNFPSLANKKYGFILEEISLHSLTSIGTPYFAFEGTCVLKIDDSFICIDSKNNEVEPDHFAYKSLTIDLKNQALEWRAKLLKEAMKIGYYDNNAKQNMEIYVCPKILAAQDKYYFMIDLTQRKSQTDTCSV